jgi:hypothetical protein
MSLIGQFPHVMRSEMSVTICSMAVSSQIQPEQETEFQIHATIQAGRHVVYKHRPLLTSDMLC